MSDLYREIRKNRILLEQRKPWKEETVRQLLEWETGNFIYSCMYLDGKNLSREAVQAIVSGELVRKASFADYATAQGLEAAADYLRKLAADIETPFERVLVSKTAFDKLPTEAELCLLWCFLEGKSEAEARAVWDAKSHYRKLSPVVHALSHVPCHFSEIPAKMAELYAWLRDACAGRADGSAEEGRGLGEKQRVAFDAYGTEAVVNPVALAAEFHNRLLALWPFESHNEDLAKLAAESVLLAFGLPLVPWSMTEQEYYDAGRAYLASVETEQYGDDGFAAGSGRLRSMLETLIHRCQIVWLGATEH